MTVDEIFQVIRETIADAIAEEWTEASLYVERLHKYTGIEGHYKNASDELCKMSNKPFKYPFPMSIHELHDITTADGQNRWNKLNVTLHPSKKIEVNYIWDQEFQDKSDAVK